MTIFFAVFRFANDCSLGFIATTLTSFSVMAHPQDPARATDESLFRPLIVGGTAGHSARAEVCVYGAHVLSWKTPDGKEQLYLSGRSAFREGTAIRGGIPIIFPQFSTFGPLPRHGFARTRAWNDRRPVAKTPGPVLRTATTEPSDVPSSSLTFRMRDDDATRALWPHAFVAGYEVAVDVDVLRTTLNVRNTGDTPFAFTAALHTYLRVRDVADVSLGGLAGMTYRDATQQGAEGVQQDSALFIAGEVDRVYLDVPGPVTLREPGRVVEVRSPGFRDVVIWNPGERLGDTIPDLDIGGWRHFVCLEAATIAQPIWLAPNESWTGRQILRAFKPRP